MTPIGHVKPMQGVGLIILALSQRGMKRENILPMPSDIPPWLGIVTNDCVRLNLNSLTTSNLMDLSFVRFSPDLSGFFMADLRGRADLVSQGSYRMNEEIFTISSRSLSRDVDDGPGWSVTSTPEVVFEDEESSVFGLSA